MVVRSIADLLQRADVKVVLAIVALLWLLSSSRAQPVHQQQLEEQALAPQATETPSDWSVTLGLRFDLNDRDGFRFGPMLGYLPGREGDDPHLQGLGNFEASATAGLFGAYRVGPFEASASLRQAVTHLDGAASLALGPDPEFAFGLYAPDPAESDPPAIAAFHSWLRGALPAGALER